MTSCILYRDKNNKFIGILQNFNRVGSVPFIWNFCCGKFKIVSRMDLYQSSSVDNFVAQLES